MNDWLQNKIAGVYSIYRICSAASLSRPHLTSDISVYLPSSKFLSFCFFRIPSQLYLESSLYFKIFLILRNICVSGRSIVDLFAVCLVLIEMASDETSAACMEEEAPDLANGLQSSGSKVAAEEVEDKLDDLTLNEPQGHLAAGSIRS